MKLTIKKIIPVSNLWNCYVDQTIEEAQEKGLPNANTFNKYKYYPVAALALVEDVGHESWRTGEEFWKYIDVLDIQGQHNEEAFSGLRLEETIFSENDPNE